MSDFTEAATEAQHELDKRDYSYQEAIIYVHPNALKEELYGRPELAEFPDQPKINGAPIEETRNVPENIVMAVHLDAIRLGPEAVAFGTIEDNDE